MSHTRIPLYPDNDLALKARIRVVDPGTGLLVPMTGGTVTAFLSTANVVNASPAHATLEIQCTHIGDGYWLALWDKLLLTFALLNPIFGGAGVKAYAHFVTTGDISRFVELEYLTVAPAELSA